MKIDKLINGIFQGSGIKHIAFVGAACCFEDNGYIWNRLGGTSGGSIVAALLAVGYTAKELKSFYFDNDLTSYLTKDKLQSIPILGKPLGLLFETSIYTTDGIEKELDSLFGNKGKHYFKDILINQKSRLRIVTSDISTFQELVIPNELKKRGFTSAPLDFSIAKAVCMSIARPYFLKPIKLYDEKNKLHIIVDGGLISNFPLDAFKIEASSPYKTIGFMSDSHSPSKTIGGKINVISFTEDIVTTALEQNDYVCDVYYKNSQIIEIPTFNIPLTKLSLSKAEKEKLFHSGYASAEKFIKNMEASESDKKSIERLKAKAYSNSKSLG